jgi:N-acetylneuraminic acid mutarotase
VQSLIQFKKAIPQSAHLLRGAFYLLLVSVCAIPFALAQRNAPKQGIAKLGNALPMLVSHRTLTFAERVFYQRAIEEVYWRHRIWPEERPDPKPSLDEVMPPAQLEKKVEDYLRDSEALEEHWQQPLRGEQLQAEMERMAQHTKQPKVLRELFEALGNDPFVIAECLARPVLAQRLVAELNNEGRSKLMRVAWLKPQSQLSVARAGAQAPVKMAALNANYTLPTISEEAGGCTDDTWTATSTTNAPVGRDGHTAVWTGSEMIVWGGFDGDYLNTGGRYNPSTDSWTATSTVNAPSARELHTAVWTGSEMIVWGGLNLDPAGGRYNPSTDSWTATSLTNAPTGRFSHTAVWTGSEMIIWGGHGIGVAIFNTGGKYNPNTDSWTATSTVNAPSARDVHTAVWTGSEMIVWGGATFPVTNTGGRYNPSTDTWTATSTTSAPSARGEHTAVWAGTEMIIWGGSDPDGEDLNTGGRYNPDTDSWTATSSTNAPTAREFHTAVWTGSEMIVWGGSGGFIGPLNTGGRYNPSTDTWTATSTTNAPTARDLHTAVWTDSEMIIWGGAADNTGGRYCAQTAPPPTPTPTPTATATATPTATATATATPTATATATPTATPTATATPTSTPVVTTSPATHVASFSATLNGSLNPRGSTTTVYFQYGSSTSYGSTTATQTKTGNTVQNISANISGLVASHIYHFRIVAHNNGGTSFGSDRTFTTLSATGPPLVITNPATNVARSSATLNGSLDPHGLTTTVYFQYGTTTSYGHTTAMQTKTGNTYRNIAANISGLSASTTYHFRIVAHNSAGTRFGSDRTFTTP